MGMHCPEEPKKTKIDVAQVLDYAKRHNLQSDSTSTVPNKSNKVKEAELLIKVGTSKYILFAGLAGTFVCGGSHLLSTPLDVLKCRIQVDQSKYPDLKTAFRTSIKEEGVRGLSRGWAPTLLGYGAQGFAKFGFYEPFKKVMSEYVGPENTYLYRTAVFACAAGLAEAVGDVALAPFEAAKIRTQTRPGAPAQMFRCLPEIVKEEGVNGLFKGLPALWMRQFVCFEFAVDYLHKLLNKPKTACTKTEQLQISMTAGIVAGIVSAICSHPPDVIVSQLYKNPDATFTSVCRQLGFAGVWAGLATRILMIGSIAASQLFIVDSVKLALHLERPPLPQMPDSLKKKLEK